MIRLGESGKKTDRCSNRNISACRWLQIKIAISSSIPSEGKSLFSVLLALNVAEIDKKVLIIESGNENKISKVMTFSDHLEELRQRILNSIYSILISIFFFLFLIVTSATILLTDCKFSLIDLLAFFNDNISL